jgi:hypothetical protein
MLHQAFDESFDAKEIRGLWLSRKSRKATCAHAFVCSSRVGWGWRSPLESRAAASGLLGYRRSFPEAMSSRFAFLANF